MAVGSVGLSPNVFWALIPKEFDLVVQSWNENVETAYQTSWEQTRMSIYYQYLGIPKKGRNDSYQKFKLNYLPFPWDKINRKEVDTEDIMAEEQPINPDEWKDRISKLQNGAVVKDKELEQIKGKLT